MFPRNMNEITKLMMLVSFYKILLYYVNVQHRHNQRKTDSNTRSSFDDDVG